LSGPGRKSKKKSGGSTDRGWAGHLRP
jgi:hypothetical protein